jgi:hypothetical protein
MAITILPTAGQSLDVTRDPIRLNFQTIDTGLQVDHVQLDLAAPNSGKHKAVHLVNQAVAPAAPVTGAGEMALYTASIGGASQLFFKGENSAAAVNGFNLTGTAGLATPGWMQLINGVIFKWGVATVPAAANEIISWIIGEDPAHPVVGCPLIVIPLSYWAVQLPTAVPEARAFSMQLLTPVMPNHFQVHIIRDQLPVHATVAYDYAYVVLGTGV